jgi:class 3 adenylate cyclase/tetratricopeptide (TPR) repeat protein
MIARLTVLFSVWLSVFLIAGSALAEAPEEATTAYEAGDYALAIRLLEESLKDQPDDAATENLLLECYRAVYAADRLREVLQHTESAMNEGVLAKVGRDTLQKLDLEKLERLTALPDFERLRNAENLGAVAKALDIERIGTLSDYLTMTAFYEKLGDPKGTWNSLSQIVRMDPEHAAANLKLGLLTAQEGRTLEAEAYFIRFLNNPQARTASILGAYAFAYVNAKPFMLAGLAVVLLGSGLLLSRLLGGGRKHVWMIPTGIVALVCSGAGLSWWSTRSLMSFAVLALLALTVIVGLIGWLIASHGGRGLAFVEKNMARLWSGAVGLMSGRVSGRLAQLPTRYLVLMLVLLPPVTASIVVAIPQVDIRLMVLVAMGLLLFTIIGALALSFLERNRSLGRTLKYISLFNTIPFLIVFIYLAGGVMEKVLFLSFNALDPWESRLFFATLSLYGVSLAFAMYLAVVQTQAILEPVQALNGGLERVEAGDLDVHLEERGANELGLLSLGFNRMVDGLRQREFIRKTFGKFVDPRVVERVLQKGSIDLGGKNARCVIMFTDIRGFTTLSEHTSPPELVDVLNDYFTRMVRVVEEHGGLVNKFIGDAMMVVWGGLLDDDPDPAAAIRAGLEMQRELERFNHDQESKGGLSLKMGIGINYGEVVAGHLGSRDRLEWTVIGDTVNLAQRAESLAKHGQVLVTPTAFARTNARFDAVQLDPVAVKGKEKPVAFFNVTGEQTHAPDPETAA